METVLIDEEEIKNKFVEKAGEINRRLLDSLKHKMIEYGLNPGQYVGGLTCTISSKDLSLEQNINNLFAAYSINYIESMFFQCENIKMMNTLNLVQRFLTERGLEFDYLRFKESKETNQMKHNQSKIISQPQ